MFIESSILPLLFLLGSISITGLSTALLSLGKLQGKEEIKKIHHLFFFQLFLKSLFGEKRWEGLFFCLSFAKHLFQMGFVLFAFFFLAGPTHTTFLSFLSIGALAIAIALLLDFLINLVAVVIPVATLRFFSPIASLYLLLALPITAPLFRFIQLFLPKKPLSETFKLRDKILDILHETEISKYLEPSEQKLILSLVSFKERMAREVMVPRIDVFSLPAETTIAEAAQRFLTEGYSRIPIYKDNVDNIIGVLLYKDVLRTMTKQGPASSIAIETLVKPVLYTPETKKISQLLQEFRNKKIHLAIVVDEYGGTEGIVTFEDIIEELVGEIADEYDIGEEALYTALPSGAWIVDAKMSIIDIEEELGIKIPQSPEYDTIGGYIFDTAGTIPTKGWKIHHDDFDLEVLSSDERSLDKIRITPHPKVGE